MFIFFKRFAVEYEGQHDYRRKPGTVIPDSEIVETTEAPMTTADVEKAFAGSRPPVED